MYYGLYGLMDKLARTLATVLVAGMLDVTGYVPNVAQSADALQGITLMTGVLPGLCLVLAIPLLLAYPITRSRHAEIRGHTGMRRPLQAARSFQPANVLQDFLKEAAQRQSAHAERVEFGAAGVFEDQLPVGVHRPQQPHIQHRSGRAAIARD
mgnify:CR=1 FL=1